jgi:uncharacterized membrane protein YhhN
MVAPAAPSRLVEPGGAAENPVGRRVRLAASGLCALAVAGMVAEWILRDRGVLRQLIGAASTAYLFVALAGGTERRGYQRGVVIALSFCWLGDIIGPKHFLTGVVMFLLAHLAFVGAFVAAGLHRRRLLGSLLIAGVIGGVVAWLILPRVPEAQRPLIWIYSAVLTAMLGVAGGTLGAGSRGLVPLAAVLFFVSDLCLAQTAFLGGGVTWTFTGYPIYYAACLLFAWSVTERPAGGAA